MKTSETASMKTNKLDRTTSSHDRISRTTSAS